VLLPREQAPSRGQTNVWSSTTFNPPPTARQPSPVFGSLA
jgi:hypothetical protein